jgi:hypothetical protein
MKKVFVLIAILGIILSNCKSNDNDINCTPSPTSIPACIQAKIDSIKNVPVWNPPASVYSYVYKNQTVYSFSADCCDQYNVVYDTNCKVICSPSGGITGSGDGRCPDFQKIATNETLIWKDSRKK